jgi:hypothetical protein
MRCSRQAIAVVAVVATAFGAPRLARAEPQESPQIDRLERRVAELEATIESMKDAYDTRFAAIEQQLAALSGTTAAAEEGAAMAAEESMSAAERADLEAELAAILGEAPGAGETTTAEPSPGGAQRFTSQTQNLNRLNPEISAAGDMFGVVGSASGDPESNQFRLGEFEVALQATLDPYSAAKFILVQEGDEIGFEEGWIDYSALPGGLGVKAGKMRLDWGKLNRWHQHALPQADRPLVHQAMLGEEGLNGLGVSTSWLPPAFLGDYNEVIVQVVNDNNDVAFSGRGFDQPVYLIHETNYFDISPATYFELGLSASTGTADLAGEYRNGVFGADWNLNWSPPETSLYRGFELRGELMWTRRNGPDGRADALGAYTYGVFKLSRRSFVGLRGDWTELPEAPDVGVWGASPYFEWWQSEYARLRFQYSYLSRRFEEPQPEHRFYFQLTWAIGPHKHEKY